MKPISRQKFLKNKSNKLNKHFILFIVILLIYSCSGGDSQEMAESDLNMASNTESTTSENSTRPFEDVYMALSNKNFSGDVNKLYCYYPNGKTILTSDQNSVNVTLSFNGDSLVYFYWPIIDEYKIQAAVYHIREVSKAEDPYFDDQPTHYYAEFYTSFGELVRLTFSKSLDFENEDLMKKSTISVSAKFLDYNLVKKLDDEILPKVMTDPFAPDAELKAEEIGKQYVSSRKMQCGVTCTLSDKNIDVDWTNPILWKE